MDMKEISNFEKPVVTIKLSEAIRKGIPHVRERKSHYGCALACAYYGVTGKEVSYFGRVPNTGSLAEIIGAPFALCEKISTAHYSGQMTREQCADYAESQGY